MSASPFLDPGAVLAGRYEIVREVGRGGYSVVYLARDRTVGTDVALKLLVPPPAAAQVARERMRREVQAVRGLSHPNIVAVFDFLEDGPWSFIVMEYVAGPDLQMRVRERGPLDVEQTVRVGRDIAAALTMAHRRGVLHRDVKPPNLLLDPDGRTRLTDFGSARLDGQLGVTGTGALAGTLAYTSPEVLAGRRGDARADVYALGLTLYFALTGDLPERPSPHLPPVPSADGFRPSRASSKVPQWLDDVIALATAAAAENRFPTAVALNEALASQAPVPHAGTANGAPCMLCGGPDPLALGICPACGGGAPESADTLVIMERERDPAARRAAALRLAVVMPDLSDTDRAAAALGRRPLFRVPSVSAPRLVDELRHRELSSRALPAGRALDLVPASYWALVAVVIAAGGAAGMIAAPPLLATTPLVGVLLVLGARRSARTPLVLPPARLHALAPAVERAVVQTLAELSPGTARNLLADLVRMCSALSARLERTGDDRGLGPTLAELLQAGCSAATDLAQLDENLGRFERQQDQLASLPEGWLDTLGRSERTRDALVQRLLEAMTVVGRLQGQQAALAGESDETLAELIQELRRESDAQGAAAREMKELLPGAV
ncbi:MAG: protein kinase domain-containing protein [Gemmatimonadales bacterium]